MRRRVTFEVRLRDVRVPIDPVHPVRLNDLFALFPELPRFQHRPLAEQIRGVRQNIDQPQERARKSMARQRAAAQVKGSWSPKRRG